MKSKILISGLLFAGLLFAFPSCEKQNEPEAENLVHPIEKTDAYYANLRAYKKTDHQIAWGWFGNWTAKGPAMSTRMTTIPDSVDIIGLWGGAGAMDDPVKVNDMRTIQQRNGTKVVTTMILGDIGKGTGGAGYGKWPAGCWPRGEFKGMVYQQNVFRQWVTDSTFDRTEAWKLYAKVIAEEIVNKWGFDGFDIDYEPLAGGSFNQDTWLCARGDTMKLFVEELGRYLGPKSGTGKLLIIDGDVNNTPNDLGGLGDYFDWVIAQAYGESAPQSKATGAITNMGIPSTKFVVTDNFENTSGWSAGGVLLQQARWQPTQGRKGGCGTYHMEYEYMHTDKPEYYWMRQAIQIMNPAVK